MSLLLLSQVYQIKSTSNTSAHSFILCCLLCDLNDVRFLLELIEEKGNYLEYMLRDLFLFLGVQDIVLVIIMPDCDPVPVTESYHRLEDVRLLFSVDEKPHPTTNSFLTVVKALHISCLEPFAVFVENTQGFCQYVDIVVSAEHVLVVLLVIDRKPSAYVVQHLPGNFVAAQEVVDCALAALAAQCSLLFEVEVARQIHSYLISISEFKQKNKLQVLLSRQYFLYLRIQLVVFYWTARLKQLVFNIGINLLNYKHMQGNSSVIQQLANVFNSLFCKDSLRKNNYIFNSLNERMEISIRTIAKQRRVAQITNDFQQIIIALKQCPYVEMQTGNFVKILMKGDDLIVKLTHSQSKKIVKKEVQALTKHMKCELKENHDNFLIEFQSNAAITEFIDRVKASGKDYKYEIMEKNPYRCIEESIGNMRKQKKNFNQGNTYEHQQAYSNVYYSYDMSPYYSEQYPVFIRRAIPSDDEAEENSREKAATQKKYIQKPKSEVQQRPRFNSDDFPSFDRLNISEEAKEERV